MKLNQRGEAVTIVLLCLVLLGGGFFMLRPKWSHAESRRATASVVATQQVEQKVYVADEAAMKQAAAAAASVATIGVANTLAPDSPAKDFITREVPAALVYLPKPDPQALLDAEKRRSAVMEGRAYEATRLYEAESKRSLNLQEQRDTALAARDVAMSQRRQADERLAEAAAASRAASKQAFTAFAVAALLAIGWVYTKLTHLSPAGLGRIATDIRSGRYDAITAIDIGTPPWTQRAAASSQKTNDRERIS
jgi:hypothetical protein